MPTLTRDSAVLTLGAFGALLTYLIAQETPPMLWSYTEWLQILAFCVAWSAGKLSTSPLQGENDANKVSGPRMWFLPILLVSAIGMAACGGKGITLPPQPPTEEQVQAVRAKAIQILSAVEKASALVLSVQQSTQAAAEAKLITPQQRDVVYQHILDLAPRINTLVDMVGTVTADPDLRVVVRAIMRVVDRFLADLELTGHPTLQQSAAAIRAALAVVSAYLGGDL